MHHDRYLSHKLLFMEPKGSDIAKSLAVQVVNPCKSVLDKKEPSNQLMQLQRNQRSNDIESTVERILVERQLVIQTCSSHAKQMRCLKWWVQSSTSFWVLPRGYILELHNATFECQQITSTPFNHRDSGTWSGMRRGITTQAGYELQSLYSLFNSLTFQNRAPKKRNNSILNKVSKNNYKMLQGCRWKLVTIVVKCLLLLEDPSDTEDVKKHLSEFGNLAFLRSPVKRHNVPNLTGERMTIAVC